MQRRHLLQAALAGSLPLFAHAQEASDIVVAQIGPFTVLPAPDAKELNEGLKAAFDEINDKGGIGGRRIQLISMDDTYTFDGFKARLDEVMPKKPVALLSPLGSATLKGLLDSKLLDSLDIMILNAVPGAGVLRDPGHPKLFHIRAGDEQQIEKIISHAKALNIKSMGVLYQDIPIGTSGLAAAKAAAADGGLEIVEAKASTDAASILQAAQSIGAKAPQSGLVIGAPKFSGEGIAALRTAGMSQQLFTLSYLPAPALQKFAGKGARGVGIAQTYPNPNGVTSPLHRSLRAAMRKSHPDTKTYTPFHMEGYVTGRVFIDAARKARTVTPANVAEALRKAGEIDLGGFRVNFSKGNIGSTWVDIGVVTSDGRLMY